MSDRRSFFRFWPSSAPTSRRTSSIQSTAPQQPPRQTTTSTSKPSQPPKPEPKSSSSPSRNKSSRSKPNQYPSPSHLSPKEQSTPNSSPSRKDSQAPSTPPRASPSRSPKKKQPISLSKEEFRQTSTREKGESSSARTSQESTSNEKGEKSESSKQDHVDDSNEKIVSGASIKRDEMELVASKSSDIDATLFEKELIDKEDSSNVEDEPKPSMEVKASPEEIGEVKEVSREKKSDVNEETKELPENNAQMDKQEVIETENSKPKPPVDNAKPGKRSARVNGKVAISHKDDILTYVNRVMNKDDKNSEPLASVIILAGENRGASMQMGSKGGEGLIHIHRGYKIKSDKGFNAKTDEQQGISKDAKPEDAHFMEDQQLPEAYVNNNTQGINNSIVFNSFVTEKSPGVHLTIADQLLKRGAVDSKERGGFTELKKIDFSMSHAKKLTYEPRIRRRCLKGLFLETSDSDDGNPVKSRRHGCRVGCKETTI